MSIVSVSEFADSPSGSFSLDSASFERRFRVVTDSKNDGPKTVINAVGIPALYTTYVFNSESHSFARVEDIAASRLAPNSLIWEVTCSYAVPKAEEDDEEPENPLEELPDLQVSFQEYDEIVKGEITGSLKDTFNDAIKNSAGEVFDPPPLRKNASLIMTITRNENIAANHPQIGREYGNTTNSGVFFGNAIGTCLMKPAGYSVETKNLSDGTQTKFLKVVYSIHVKEEGWDVLLLDKGSYYIHAVTGKKMIFRTEDGEAYTGLLDGNGQPSATPVYLDPIQIYVSKDWSPLNLPSTNNECN